MSAPTKCTICKRRIGKNEARFTARVNGRKWSACSACGDAFGARIDASLIDREEVNTTTDGPSKGQEGTTMHTVSGAGGAFLKAYITCALWSSNDDGGDSLDANYDVDDLAPSALRAMREDCARFEREAAAELEEAYGNFRNGGANPREYTASDAGHDFWLSRNGHGAGFFDRDLAEAADKLQERARAFGDCELYVGDDGKIYVSGKE